MSDSTMSDQGRWAGHHGDERTREINKLAMRLARIAALWEKLLFVKWDEKAFDVLHRLVCGLDSGAAQIGRDDIHRRAKDLGNQICSAASTGSSASSVTRNRISAQINSLKKVIHRQPGVTRGILTDNIDQTRASVRDDATLVYLLEPDTEQADSIMLCLKQKGYAVRCFSDPDELQQSISDVVPDAIVADVMNPTDPRGGIRIMGRLKQDVSFNKPLIFVSSRGDLAARLQAIRVGGDGYFTKPVDAEALGKKLDLLTQVQSLDPYRVLLVDNVTGEVDSYMAALRQAGMAVKVSDSPMQLLKELDEYRPDLLVLGIGMQQCSGVELVQLMRQEERYADLPVIFLAGKEDVAEQSAALRQGGDALLSRPVAGEHLVAAVVGRVRRARELANRLQYFNTQDLVTGLHNRRYFMAAAEHAYHEMDLEQGVTAVLYLELDNFRKIRDRIGLATADLLLSDVAQLLGGRLRTGEILARFGDCSFALLVRNSRLADMQSCGESLCSAVADEVYAVGDQTLVLTCSIGVAVLGDRPGNAEQWIAAAAMSSDVAQAAGGNRVHVYSPIANQCSQQDCQGRYRHMVREALQENRFRLVYQPIAGLRGDRKQKYEVLVRMTDADEAEIMPAKFLPTAREAGLIGAVDRWVVAEAIRTLAQYKDTGREMILFVKITEAFMQAEGTIPWLESQLAESGVSGAGLVFELDEKEISASLAMANAFAMAVRRLQCGFALEHFGTSLDSANLLLHMPVDYIKIDGSFTHKLGQTPANQDSIRTMVERASAVGILSVAELVEDAACLAMLWQCGVHYIQGNFLQEPDQYMLFDFDAELAAMD